MKVKVLSRNPDDYKRETKLDLHKVVRNYDPALHPFQDSREYIRALNATKLNRVFAKPFIASLDGHRDGVSCMSKHRKQLNAIFSGSYDGELKQWNLTTQRCIWSVQAHNGWVRGVTSTRDGTRIISVGDDKTIKHWSSDITVEDNTVPINSIVTQSLYSGIDYSWHEDLFATSGQTVDIWNPERAEPIKTFKYENESISTVRFNPIEFNQCLSTASDRGIILYDIRANVAVNKLVLAMRSNVAVWNPIEAFIFTAANEDHNLHTFDIRHLKYACNVHTDHVDAVLDVDYSPTGQEFVSGSYDKTIRIFPAKSNRSREVYHTKRMQRLTTVKWAMDNKYILSGSDETNIRLWKANASEQLGNLAPRQKTATLYNQKLMEKYRHHPQIRRIAKHRHVPKAVYSATKEKREMKNSAKRKEQNRRMNSKPGTVPIIPERRKHIVGQAVDTDSD